MCRKSLEVQWKRDVAHADLRGTGIALSKRMSVTPENSTISALEPELAVKPSLSQVIYGSCFCGDVGFRIAGSPLRRIDGSTACAASLFVPARLFRWTRGESQVVSYRLPGPGAYATAFCRRCGSDLPRQARSEAMLVVPAPSIGGRLEP
jgi:hypothetical protein